MIVTLILNADLHSHSNVSDGVLTPGQLAARAKANGVDLWSLTDHDEIDGIAAARAAADELKLNFVAGVEISVTWADTTLHIVGLRIDETNRELNDGLVATRNGRERRAHQIAAQLADAGIPDAYSGALKYVANPDLISRTHFARYIVEFGVCRDIGQVFERYLIKGKPGYVPHCWATLEQAVTWIRGAGGVAVLAHPGRYDLNGVALNELLSEFKRLGGAGIEVVTGSHRANQFATFAKIARDYGLLASRGSDFHAPGESHCELGALPPLPPSLQPVWHNFLLAGQS